MPVLAIYGQSLEGFSPIWIGFAIGAYGLTQAAISAANPALIGSHTTAITNAKRVTRLKVMGN